MKIETKLISASCSTKRYKNKQDFSGAMKMISDLTILELIQQQQKKILGYAALFK